MSSLLFIRHERYVRGINDTNYIPPGSSGPFAINSSGFKSCSLLAIYEAMDFNAKDKIGSVVTNLSRLKVVFCGLFVRRQFSAQRTNHLHHIPQSHSAISRVSSSGRARGLGPRGGEFEPPTFDQLLGRQRNITPP